MKAKLLVSTAFLAASVSLSAQKSATITVHADQGKEIIPKEIYGQFAEHLGSCIYGGLWVGEKSDIPNIKGYRTDVFNALKDLAVPVLRWPTLSSLVNSNRNLTMASSMSRQKQGRIKTGISDVPKVGSAIS